MSNNITNIKYLLFLLFFLETSCYAENTIILAKSLELSISPEIKLKIDEPIIYISEKDGITLDYLGKYNFNDYEKMIIIQFRFNINLNEIKEVFDDYNIKRVEWEAYDPGASRDELFKNSYVNTIKKENLIIKYSYNDWANEFLWDLSHYLILFPEKAIFKECYILLADVWLYNHKEVSGNQYLKVEELKKKNPEKAVLYNLLEEFIFSVEYIGPLNEDTKALKNTAEQP